jgi:uncharacterized repeat protein (TIGR01451 family)
VLASGEVATIRIDVTTQGAGTITNGAAVTADEADPNYSNNTDLESTVVQGADLALAQSDSPDPASVGQRLTYTIQIDNAGPDMAQGVTLTDKLGKGLRFSSASSTQGRCVKRTRTTVECNLADLAVGDTATVTLAVRATRPGNLSNSASIRASQPPDPNLANNTATETTTVQR